MRLCISQPEKNNIQLLFLENKDTDKLKESISNTMRSLSFLDH